MVRVRRVNVRIRAEYIDTAPNRKNRYSLPILYTQPLLVVRVWCTQLCRDKLSITVLAVDDKMSSVSLYVGYVLLVMATVVLYRYQMLTDFLQISK